MRRFTYPSIDGPTFEFLDQPCVAFEKLDGSNLRFFWDQQRGWHSAGTRHMWFKPKTPTFGPAFAQFKQEYGTRLLEAMRPHKEYRGVKELVAFAEFFGAKTFSGSHIENDPKRLVLFDIYLGGRGFVPPKDFAAHFGHLPIAPVVYEGPFSRAFIEDVAAGKYPVAEGVVAKGLVTRRQHHGQAGQEVWMAKVKTRTWLAELARRCGDSVDLRRELEDNEREQGTDLGEPAA